MINFEIDILSLLKYNPQEPLLFSSGFFLWWFLAIMFFYSFINHKQSVKVIYLLLVSYFFYYKSGGIYFYLLIISTLTDFFIGKWLYIIHTRYKRKLLLVLSLIINLGILGYFKYTNFFIDTINSTGVLTFNALDIFLPIGISFYTFQTLSYTIDIYRNKLKPTKRILDFAFFVSFFPQLVAGPIVRASEFIPQIRQKVHITKEQIGRGIYLILIGLFKKAVISDYISINYVDRVFDQPLLYSGLENLMAVYAYALQIYCDFSGYSDMAIGLALLMGFKLPKNFDAPYKASSITEFWRRWHISLSSWLRDYLYIPLGGNKKGPIRMYIHLIITMLLGGLWHGASWKFVIWGLMHGCALALEKLFKNIIPCKKTLTSKILGIFLTFHFVCFCWIFFRAASFEQAKIMIMNMVNNFWVIPILDIFDIYKNIIGLLILGFMLHFLPQKIDLRFEKLIIKSPLIVQAFYIVLLIWIVVQIKAADIQPFIYFQF